MTSTLRYGSLPDGALLSHGPYLPGHEDGLLVEDRCVPGASHAYDVVANSGERPALRVEEKCSLWLADEVIRH